MALNLGGGTLEVSLSSRATYKCHKAVNPLYSISIPWGLSLAEPSALRETPAQQSTHANTKY